VVSGDASELEALFGRLGAATNINAVRFSIDGVMYYRAPNGKWSTRKMDMPPPQRHKLRDDKMSRLLAVVRRRVERTTPGPWRYEQDTNSIHGGEAMPGDHVAEVHGPQDGTFIAHAREDILALIAEVERQHGKRDALRYQLTELKDAFVFGIDDVTLESARRQALWALMEDDED